MDDDIFAALASNFKDQSSGYDIQLLLSSMTFLLAK